MLRNTVSGEVEGDGPTDKGTSAKTGGNEEAVSHPVQHVTQGNQHLSLGFLNHSRPIPMTFCLCSPNCREGTLELLKVMLPTS